MESKVKALLAVFPLFVVDNLKIKCEVRQETSRKHRRDVRRIVFGAIEIVWELYKCTSVDVWGD